MSAIEQAIQTAGGATSFARMMGVKTPAVVYQWRVTRVPAEYCPRIERLTGVRCEDLRPDVEWGVLRTASQAEAA